MYNTKHVNYIVYQNHVAPIIHENDRLSDENSKNKWNFATFDQINYTQ